MSYRADRALRASYDDGDLGGATAPLLVVALGAVIIGGWAVLRLRCR